MAYQASEMKLRSNHIIVSLFTAMVLLQSCVATQSVSTLKKITVAADGSGDYKTLQGALNSLPDSSATGRTIFIKKGIYSSSGLMPTNSV